MTVDKLVKTMVEGIADDLNLISVVETETDKGLMIEVKVGRDDVGKIIGKEGRVASAIRTVAKAAGAKVGKRVMVNIFNKPVE